MSLQLIEHEDPRSFRDVVIDRLLQAEAENCVQLGLVERMAREGYAPVSVDELDRPLLGTIRQGSAIDCVAMQTMKQSMLVTRTSDQAAAYLAERLAKWHWAGEALVGVAPSIQTLSARFAEFTGRPRRLAVDLRVFELREVRWPAAPAPGHMRLCGPGDRELLAEYVAGFEADTEQSVAEDALSRADRLIAARRVFFWVDRRPVAMAAWAGPTPNGVRVNFVYAPPQSRCHGYASTLVASLSQHLLDTGRKFCCLFTDRANPTSNSIYQKIGYRFVSDGQRWNFGPA